ncbi:asparaginase domain-containing protein [bacterium]|nr:asparaginase domain-containing protein [bacterium]
MIDIFTTGGTIDKIYFDAKSDYEVGDPQIAELLRDSNLTLDYRVISLLRKDSLEMTDDDRQQIRDAIEASDAAGIVVTHGTDTMIETGRRLQGVAGKTIVLTGAMQPARFRSTDAIFNVASAITAAQTLPPGVYIAMNGRIFDPLSSRKNAERNLFEEI